MKIKNFGLYGREASTVAPEFVHLVSIGASCRKHNWVIKPHFHSKLYQFFLIEKGSGTFIFNEREKYFDGRALIIMPENNLHGFQFNDDIKGYTLSVSSDIINQIFSRDADLAVEINRVRQLDLNHNKEDFEFLITTIISIQRELANQDEKVILALEKLICLFLIKTFRLRGKIGKEYVGSNRELTYYKDFIAEYFANESMILLTHIDMTVSEVAHQLEFKDVSYFCRFFKNQTTLSPAEFRKQNNNKENNITLNY